MSFDFTSEKWNELLELREKGWTNCNEVEQSQWTQLQTEVCLSEGVFKEKFVKFLNHKGELHKV